MFRQIGVDFSHSLRVGSVSRIHKNTHYNAHLPEYHFCWLILIREQLDYRQNNFEFFQSINSLWCLC